jgi:uncharacterized OB-fold protein
VQPRIGRWSVADDGAVTLHGNSCRNCGETFFPERAHCPRCRSTDLDEVLLAGPAKLLSYTVVHQAPAGFATPLAVGYGAFAGDAVVLAPIDAPLDSLHKGMTLALTKGQTSVATGGTPFVSYRFEGVATDA